MGNLNETEKWEEKIYQLETSDPVLGGADGISNRAPRQLANRTKWLKKKTEEAAQSLAEHVRSRNHPDATLTAKGFTQLSSATNSTSETLAATPKAVKAAYDLAAGKAPVSHTHPWSQITGVPAASLTAKGTVQLSSATDSQSETEAATPKARSRLHTIWQTENNRQMPRSLLWQDLPLQQIGCLILPEQTAQSWQPLQLLVALLSLRAV